MLLSLFSSVALTGLVAAGSVPHVARQAANTVTCTQVTNGSLMLQSPTTGQQWQLAVLDESPLQVVDWSRLEIFSFESCTSEFMGYTSNAALNLYYGHLVVGYGQCFSTVPDQTTGQTISPADCSMNDDSSQLDQFWTLSWDAQNPKAPGYLNFPGKPSNSTDGSYYTANLANNFATISLDPSSYLYFSLNPQ